MVREQRGVVRQWVDEPPREQDLLVSDSRLNAGLRRAAFVTLGPRLTLSTWFVITWSDGLEIRLGKRVYYGKGPSHAAVWVAF